jgi:FkbM family methyltransferase
MKSGLIRFLHFLFGYGRYLYVFSIFKISTLWCFRKKWDYLYFVNSLKSTSNVVIVGASTGITTIPLSKKCNNGKILAYEPIRINYNTILRLIKYYDVKNTTAYNVGLGNISNTSVSMYIPIIKGVKKQGMAYVNDNSITGYMNCIEEKVIIDCLDNRKELNDLRIDGIKLIAENFELEILKGAEKTITKHKPVIYCELWNNAKRLHTIEMIKTFGYKVYFRKKGELRLFDNSQYKGRNLFFIPQQ